MTEHFITLSTTEPNNNVGIVKLRHADVNSQDIVAQIVENGQSKSFEGLQPYFCLMAQETTGQGVSEESIVSFDAKKGKLTYTASDNALQFVGRNEAYFSFRKQVGDQWVEQFSTRTFHYIVEKSIYSQPFKDSNYWWTFKELNRIFNQYIEDGKKSWEEFVNQNKEIIQSVDPGGVLLTRLGIFSSFRDWDFSILEKLKNESEERAVNTKWFTGKGGTTNSNTDAISSAISYASARNLPVILDRDYILSSIEITNSVIIYGNGHTLTTEGGGESFITVKPGDTNKTTAVTIYDLYIKNTSAFNTGITNIDSELNLFKCSVSSFVNRNIFVNKLTVNGYGIFRDISCQSSPIGIDLKTTDMTIENFGGYNCRIHINGVGGNDILNNIHGWNWNSASQNWVDGSTLIKVTGSTTLTNIFADSVETAIVLPKGPDTKYTLISIVNFIYFLNKDVFPSSEPHLISNIDEFKGKININGILADANGWGWDSNPAQHNPELITGLIDSSTMTISGLTNNGFNDSHNINRKYNQNKNFYTVQYSNISIYDASIEVQNGKGLVNMTSSLITSIPPGGKVLTLTLTDPSISNVTSYIVSGSAIQSDNSIHNLGITFSKDTKQINIYNSSNVTYDSLIQFQLDYSCIKY